jgi:REP element-mobilizing transposase RayT
MGYTRRSDGPERLFHITCRVNWCAWHLEDERAKRALANLLADSAVAFSVRLLAAVLMSNHFHLVVQSPPEPVFRRLAGRRTKCRHFRPYPPQHQNSSVIAQFMRSVRRTMSVRRQKELELSGRFWEGQYDARSILDPFSLVVRIAYDHRNPVKEGMVGEAEDYRWSSAAQWATGEAGAIPVDIREPLPFGLSFEKLQSQVLEYQTARKLDECSTELDSLFAAPGGWDADGLRAVLTAHGLHDCGTRAANA